jgi:hypothetical protein
MTMRSEVTVRDASLRRLHRINRWLIAGAIMLTGALSGAAAQAFPGGSQKGGSNAKARTSKSSTSRQDDRGQHSAGTLKAAAQAPKTASVEATAGTTEAESTQESSSAAEAESTKESSSPVVSGGS